MWGICLDIALLEGRLDQNIIQYQPQNDSTAVIIQPVQGLVISLENIIPLRTPPEFLYGENVTVVSHPEVKGTVSAIIRHFKNKAFIYKITVNNKKVSRRYYAEELSSA